MHRIDKSILSPDLFTFITKRSAGQHNWQLSTSTAEIRTELKQQKTRWKWSTR